MEGYGEVDVVDDLRGILFGKVFLFMLVVVVY